MTGKEALVHVSKGLSALALEFGSLKMDKKDNEALQTLREIVQKYDKYKRAFEIFKRFVDEGNYVDLEFGVFDGTVDISDEEIELLEELLDDERSI